MDPDVKQQVFVGQINKAVTEGGPAPDAVQETRPDAQEVIAAVEEAWQRLSSIEEQLRAVADRMWGCDSVPPPEGAGENPDRSDWERITSGFDGLGRRISSLQHEANRFDRLA